MRVFQQPARKAIALGGFAFPAGQREQARFGGWRMVNITSAAWSRYQVDRLAEGASRATVNRERSALLRMFNLGVRYEMVLDVPNFDRLDENNVRDVDVTPGELSRLLSHLPAYLVPLVTVAYVTGWRLNELLSRTWADVDLEAGWLWLDRATAKNRQPKAFPLGLVPWLDETIHEQATRKREVEKTTDQIITRLFFYPEGPRTGEAIGSFRKAWATACDKAKLSGLRFHDLRRSAAVQMLEAGIPDTHAMSLLGHQTRSIFDRYAISGREVLRSQVAKLGEHYGSAPEPDRQVVSIKQSAGS